MSQKVLIATREEAGVTYGRVVKATEHMLMQDFAHTHIERVVRDKLMRNATQAESAGFNYTLPGGMVVSIGEGHAVDVQGRSYDTLPAGAATPITIPAAHVSLPRIDRIIATLVADQDDEPGPLPFRRLLSQSEQAAGNDPYPTNNENVNTRRNSVAVISVRQGVANASPAAPALGASETPLYQVRVDAGVTAIAANKVTDERRQMKSLADALVRLDTLEASPAIANLGETIDDRVNALVVDSASLTKTYDDTGNLLTLDVDAAWLAEQVDDRVAVLILAPTSGLFTKSYNDAGNALTLDVNLTAMDARYVNATGDQMGGTLHVTFGAPTGPFPIGATVGVRSEPNGAAGTTPMAVFGYAQAGLGNGDVAYGGYFTSNANRALSASGTTSFGVYATTEGGGTRWAGYFNGNVQVVGSLSKGSGTFLIDHPLDPDNKDLRHGFVESNCYGLIYWIAVSLEDGAAHVDIDEALNFSRGTALALWRNQLVISIRHPDGTHVSSEFAIGVGGEAGGLFVNLTSALAHDEQQVVVLLAAERKDPFILQAPFVDEDGNFVPEANKPALTAEDEALLDPITQEVETGNPLIGETISITVPPLIGKAGFPYHTEVVVGAVRPTRDVTFVESGS